MNCLHHPDRAGTLAVDLPSVGIKTYLCEECRDKLSNTLSGFKGKREAWDHSGHDYQVRGDDIYTRTSSGWRCENPTRERDWK